MPFSARREPDLRETPVIFKDRTLPQSLRTVAILELCPGNDIDTAGANHKIVDHEVVDRGGVASFPHPFPEILNDLHRIHRHYMPIRPFVAKITYAA
jgi:hypothetical protein